MARAAVMMPWGKQKMVNMAVNLILNKAEEFSPAEARKLRRQISGRGKVPVYFRILPHAKHIKDEKIRLPGHGIVQVKTQGLTTTISSRDKPLFHIVTIGEDRFFEKARGRRAVTLKGIETLAHELSHVSRAGIKTNRITEELEADIFTVKVLRRLGAEERVRAYIKSRPATIGALAKRFTKMEEKRVKEAELVRYREAQARLTSRRKGPLAGLKEEFMPEKEKRSKAKRYIYR